MVKIRDRDCPFSKGRGVATGRSTPHTPESGQTQPHTSLGSGFNRVQP